MTLDPLAKGWPRDHQRRPPVRRVPHGPPCCKPAICDAGGLVGSFHGFAARRPVGNPPVLLSTTKISKEGERPNYKRTSRCGSTATTGRVVGLRWIGPLGVRAWSSPVARYGAFPVGVRGELTRGHREARFAASPCASGGLRSRAEISRGLARNFWCTATRNTRTGLSRPRGLPAQRS